MHLSFLTSHNLLFFSFCKTSKKTTFSVFLSSFLVKLSKSQNLKFNISRTAWPILMILVSFCRILNGPSNEMNLFWRCSSPLSPDDCVNTLYVDANARPQGITIYWPGPRAFSVVQKPWGWAHILVQKPRGAGGGMVTDQIDTCITLRLKLSLFLK